MALPKHLGAYADIRPVLDAALRARGGEYRLPDEKTAIRWRQRANYFRTLLRKEQERMIPGIPGSSPYDEMIFSVEGPKIVFRFYEPKGEFVGPNGQSVDLATEAPESDDLEELASAVAKGIFGDD